LEQVTVEDAPNVSDELAPDEAGTAEFQAVKERMVRQGVANVSDEEVLRHLDAMRDNEALNEAAMRLEQLGGGGGLGSSRSAQSQGTTDPPLQLSSSNIHQPRYPNVGC